MKRGYIKANYVEVTTEEGKNIYNDTKRGVTFEVTDFIAEGNNYVIEIDSIIVDKEQRRTGFGSKILQDFCRGNDNNIILAHAGALVQEYPEEPDNEEYDKLFNRLEQFYTHNNFEDVTQLFDTYDGTTAKTYLYKNAAGLAAIDKRKITVKEFEEKMKNK
jgi:GNAT superfamily N-acetyltransferase